MKEADDEIGWDDFSSVLQKREDRKRSLLHSHK
jgi:hypothetical protein